MTNNTIRQAEIRVIAPDMSRGTLNALGLSGITTVGELVALGKDGTGSLRGIGSRGMMEISDFLEGLGMLREWEENL